MKWLEIIELRSVTKDKNTLTSQIEQILCELKQDFKEKNVQSYSRIQVETDYSIHLFHEAEIIDPCGSDIGLRLATILKDYGLVNHSIWKETSCS
ncbi:MAG: hypothetical protein D3922_11525 [Candidatus Electrothrix sp. AR1]|nr:hypothetical protein [Candidatus Electrothrix sp. AR1]